MHTRDGERGGEGETKEQGWSSSVLLTEICPQRVITCPTGPPKETLGSFPFPSFRTGQTRHVPDSSNHSLYLMKLLSSSYPTMEELAVRWFGLQA